MKKVIGDTMVAKQPVSVDSFYLRRSERTQYGDWRRTKMLNTNRAAEKILKIKTLIRHRAECFYISCKQSLFQNKNRNII